VHSDLVEELRSRPAAQNALTVTPHLPADRDGATVSNIPFGNARLNLKLTRPPSELIVEATGGSAGFHLNSQAPGAHVQGSVVCTPLPDVEVAISHGLPEFGAETSQLKVLD